MKSIIAFTFIAFAFSTYAQTELNQLDANGKKHGKWIIYWDANWKKTDSANAVYARYDFFHHGMTLQPMGPCGSRGNKLEVKEKSTATIGKAKVLDGEYKWYDEKGRLKFVFEIDKGQFVKYTEYRSSGVLDQVFDYTKHYDEDQPNSWYITTYDKKGKQKNIGFGGVIFPNGKAGRGRD